MRYVLRLYITGNTLASQHAVGNLAVLCREVLHDQCDVEIIDILENPQLAEEEKILATPTLVKCKPAPVRKVVGDLSLRERVLFGLGLMDVLARPPGGVLKSAFGSPAGKWWTSDAGTAGGEQGASRDEGTNNKNRRDEQS